MPVALDKRQVVAWLTSPAGDATIADVNARLTQGAGDALTTRVAELLTQELRPDVPRAVAQALCEASGPGRSLDVARVRTALGQEGAALAGFIADHQRDPGSRSRLPINELLRFAERLEGDARSLASRMPALRELARLLSVGRPLAGFHMAAVQHLFPTTETLFQAFAACGLSPDRTWLSGKPYSTDDEIQFALARDGVHVAQAGRAGYEGVTERDHEVLFASPLARRLVAEGRVDEQGLRDPAVVQLLRTFTAPGADDPKARFVLLDEGGKLVKALHQVFPPELVARCVAVEQTMRGIQVLEGMTLRCPVVDVAQSWLKKLFESPMIGESIVHDVEAQLRDVGAHVAVQPKEATVLGFGAVGQAVAASLVRRGYRVRVWDPKLDSATEGPALRALASKLGVATPSRAECLAHGQLLFGCSGRGSLAHAEWDALPKSAVLVNAASGRHELMSEVLRDAAFEPPADPLARAFIHNGTTSEFQGGPVSLDPSPLEPWDREREHCVVPGNDGARRLVVRSGFVANMAADIPPELIQLTRCLLLAAVVQATRATMSGLVAVDDEVQRFIEARVRAALAKIGIDLAAPDFRKLAGAA